MVRLDGLGCTIHLPCLHATHLQTNSVVWPSLAGIVEGVLNTCSMSTTSCVSSLNDDEAHFVPPWEWEGVGSV